MNRFYPGDIFGESIIKEKRKRNLFPIDMAGQKNFLPNRYFLLYLILLFGLGLLAVRLFTITLVEGEKYRTMSEENRIKEVQIIAPRGIIYDRDNIPLVRNIPLFKTLDGRVYFEKNEGPGSKEFIELTGREYPLAEVAAHALGYTGEITRYELEKASSVSLRAGDIVGKLGIEQAYDQTLRGVDGREVYEVDALGKIVRSLGKFAPIKGQNLQLSLSAKLQKIAREAMADRIGAVVAGNPATGEIYTLYSSPSFDPNKFIRQYQLEQIFADVNQPLFNRSISGLYPPGSTFKIVTALAGLESKTVNRETTIEDSGILRVGAFSFSNWYFTQYGKTEGMVDIVKALKRSNDIFFYKLGELTGIETIAKWAKKIGIGRGLGIEIEGEENGLMPDPEWMKKTKGENWYLGNTYHVAIGQGDILVTPLEVNAMTNLIANKGKICKPMLAKRLIGKDKSQVHECVDLMIEKETIDIIKEGMKEACATGGTGWPLFNFKVQNANLKADGVNFFQTYESTTSAKKLISIPTACKTGTAEFGDKQNRTHAWFTVFAPVENPQISVTVLVEKGGEGSNVAAPIAKKILEGWFGE